MYPGYNPPRDIKVGANTGEEGQTGDACAGSCGDGVFLMTVGGRGDREWWALDTGVFAVEWVFPRTMGIYIAMYKRGIDIHFYSTVTTT